MEITEQNISHKILVSYTNHLIAFLDVLGFSNLVFDTNVNKINFYYSIVKTILETFGDEVGIKSILVSDSTILAIEINKEDLSATTNAIRRLALIVGEIQGHLAKRGILIRGAISSGLLYIHCCPVHFIS